MSLKALYNGVIVKPVEIEEQQYGSIVVPDVGKDRDWETYSFTVKRFCLS